MPHGTVDSNYDGTAPLDSYRTWRSIMEVREIGHVLEHGPRLPKDTERKPKRQVSNRFIAASAVDPVRYVHQWNLRGHTADNHGSSDRAPRRCIGILSIDNTRDHYWLVACLASCAPTQGPAMIESAGVTHRQLAVGAQGMGREPALPPPGMERPHGSRGSPGP